MSLRAVAAAGLAAAVGVVAQRGSPPQFEVASVKQGGDVFSTRPNLSRGRVRWTTQLAYLIGYAYQLDFTRVSCTKCGSVYSIEAISDPEVTEEQVRLMVQSLLAERFKLRAHRVSTQAEGFALVPGKGGPKVKAAGADETESFVSATSPQAGIIAITGRGASISQLATTL